MQKPASSQEPPAESAEVAKRDFDYSAMLAICPDKANLRMPSPEEIKKIGPLWPKVPPEENAAYYYALAAHLMKETGEPAGSAGSPDSYAGDKAAFTVWIRENEQALAAFMKGLACKVCEFPTVFNKATNRVDGDIELIVLLRHLAWKISDAAFLEELNNRPVAAAGWYLANIHFGRQMGRGLLTQSLVGLAIEAKGTIGLDRLTANAELPVPVLQGIIEKAREAESSREEIKDILAHMELYSAGEQGPELESAQQFEKEIHRSMDIPLHLYLAEENDRIKLREFLPEAAPDPVAEWAHARREFGRMDAYLRALQVRAAVALFQKQTGRLPKKLDELVPAILPSVPLDPFSGRPLRYARTDGGWKIWCVGFDLKDHGGTTKGTYPNTMWWEGDAVFLFKLPSILEMQAQRTRSHAPATQPGAP